MIFRVPAFPMVRELYWTGEVGKWNDHSISVPQITVAKFCSCGLHQYTLMWFLASTGYQLVLQAGLLLQHLWKNSEWKDLCVTVHKKGPQYLLSSVQLQIFPAKVPETAAPRQVLSPCINMTTTNCPAKHASFKPQTSQIYSQIFLSGYCLMG